MSIMEKFAVFALYATAFYLAGSMIFEVYVDDITKNRQSQQSKGSIVTGLRSVAKPIANLIVKFIKIPEYARQERIRDLDRAGMSITPEQYTANAIALGILVTGVSLPLWLMGFKLLVIAGPIVGVFLGYSEMTKVKSQLKELDEKIEMVLPSFARTVTENLKVTRDLPEIFTRYLHDIPDTPMKTDLTRLINRLDTGENTETALLAFDNAINVPACSSFVAALIQITKGYEQDTYMEAINAEMATLNRENMKRTMDKRPGKLKKAKIAMLVGAGATLVIPVILCMTQNAGGMFG